MCGRYTLTKKEMKIVSKLPPGELELFFRERFNIAPTQTAPVILAESDHITNRVMRWGLQPVWSPYLIINAKAETLKDKPSFRDSFLSRRCLVPADGFYEWRKPEKTPFRFALPSREPFCFAGLWSESRLKNATEPTETFAIITTNASPDVAPVHQRMPLILTSDQYDDWLADTTKAEAIIAAPCPVKLDSYIISNLVNKATNEDPKCIEPLS